MDQQAMRDRALRAAHTITEQTPTDTARELARLLIHVVQRTHATDDCETCFEAAAMAATLATR